MSQGFNELVVEKVFRKSLDKVYEYYVNMKNGLRRKIVPEGGRRIQ